MIKDHNNDLYMFKALGEQTKYDILKVLLRGEKCACEIPRLIGKTQSNTSMHLAKLAKWSLVKSKRSGKMILYSIADDKVIQINKILRVVGVK